eukprot:961030_1
MGSMVEKALFSAISRNELPKFNLVSVLRIQDTNHRRLVCKIYKRAVLFADAMGYSQISEYFTEFINSLFMDAVRNRRMKEIWFILECGADVNYNSDFATSFAVVHGELELFKHLWLLGGRLEPTGGYNMDVLQYIDPTNGGPSVDRLIVAVQPDIIWAAELGSIAMVEYLAQLGVTLTTRRIKCIPNGVNCSGLTGEIGFVRVYGISNDFNFDFLYHENPCSVDVTSAYKRGRSVFKRSLTVLKHILIARWNLPDMLVPLLVSFVCE